MAVLKVGSAGIVVRHVQTALNQLVPATPLLQVDGAFGPKTLDRVMQYQKKTGLAADGAVGPLTTKAILRDLFKATFKR